MIENLRHSRKAVLYRRDDPDIVCLACRHYCKIPPGGAGRCLVRFNSGGDLFSPHGYVSSLGADPVEKKPLFHFLPGAETLSFGMLGCNFKCSYCQNWEISQAFRDQSSRTTGEETGSEEIVSAALAKNIRILVSTYNEPAITAEWAKEIFSLAKKKDMGFRAGFVSNGYLSRENVDFLGKDVDFIKIDLKSMDPEKFQSLTGANLSELLESIRYVFSKGIHLELVTLLVPGFNDGKDEIAAMADFIKDLSPEIPWHITAFHPDYKMWKGERTRTEKIEEAVSAAKESGLAYVYGGNVVSKTLNTACPGCGTLLVKRGYMSVSENRIRSEGGSGFCPVCGRRIYGVF